jgi:hypothetical protein
VTLPSISTTTTITTTTTTTAATTTTYDALEPRGGKGGDGEVDGLGEGELLADDPK